MKNTFKLVFIFFAFMVSTQVFAQDKKPKVALVLSGGGAKGIAHIRVLQALDSLGIVPDLIIGTSMGSVVGGLYAMGYSGDSIANIANNANWDYLLAGDISLSEVSVEEKSEFKKYLIELDVVNWFPKLNTSLLRDQNLREFLTLLTFPVYDIDNFDDFSIPFRAMTTDIVNGKEVILDKGSLSLAMRASMSIPSIFQPVAYKNTLLVDGGILNNFPTDVAKAMGADIIIGSEVGSGMLPKDKLDNMSSILFQASMLSSNLKIKKNKEICDILIDHAPYIDYSTSDFNKSKEIFKEGAIATNNKLSALVELSKTLKKYKQRVHKIVLAKETIILDTIIFKGISKRNYDMAKETTKLEAHNAYSAKELIDGVNRALGTRMFSKITYHSFIEDDQLGLQLNFFEYSKNQLKGSLHYDTYRGVGLVVNYTGRNILGASSRINVSVDIAEQPKARLEYQIIFGKHKTWWLRSEAIGELLKQDVFESGAKIVNIKQNYFQFNNQINKNINSLDSYVGIGINYELSHLRPKFDPNLVNNIFGLKKYNFNTIEINANYTYNSLNKVFFPTKGTYFKGMVSRAIYNAIYLEPIAENSPSIDGSTNGFSKVNLSFEKRVGFGKKMTGIVKASTNFIFEDPLESNEVSFDTFGYAGKYSLGGYIPNNRNNSYLFAGLHEDELTVNQFMKLTLALQFTPINNIYVVPHVNIASVGFTNFDDYIEDAFFPKGSWEDKKETSMLMSAGATFSYNSLLGPVNFDISYVNDIDKFRLYFSVGLLFNSSN